MNSKSKKSVFCNIKQRFMLFLPTAYANDLNISLGSKRNTLKIYLNKNMKSGRVIVNETMLYATMLNATCVVKNNQQISQSPLKVLVCHEKKFPLIKNYFFIKTLVKKKNQNRDVPKEGAEDEVSSTSSPTREPTGPKKYYLN